MYKSIDDYVQKTGSGVLIVPPTKESRDEMDKYHLGGAMRLASKLGRNLEDWEYEMFRKRPEGKAYEVVALPNGRFGVK
jgi:hypothetical protein